MATVLLCAIRLLSRQFRGYHRQLFVGGYLRRGYLVTHRPSEPLLGRWALECDALWRLVHFIRLHHRSAWVSVMSLLDHVHDPDCVRFSPEPIFLLTRSVLAVI